MNLVPPNQLINSLEEITNLYPIETHRVSEYTYCRDKFDSIEKLWTGSQKNWGSMQQGLCICLDGGISFQFDQQKVEICKGESAILPGGIYSIKLFGEIVKIVYIWKLPTKRPKEKPDTLKCSN